MRFLAIAIVYFGFLLARVAYVWQDDVEINLRDPLQQFAKEPGLGFLSGATAEARLGRYLIGSYHHGWRGGLEGDVALVNFGQRGIFNIGLNMETLADDHNDIHFRLVHVYYQASTGIKWHLGPGVWQASYRHRCSHGADTANYNRITIRSGINTSYHWVWERPFLKIDVKPGLNLYVLGQNADLNTQPKGGSFLTVNTTWPIAAPLFISLAAGINWEIVSAGYQSLYFLTNKTANWHVEPLMAARLAIRLQRGPIKSNFALHFAQNLDSGIGTLAQKTNNLSFDIDFLW